MSVKPRMIIVDDEAHVREMLNIMLSSANFEIVGEAANGREAVTMIKKEKPDIVILDINMPFKTGEELMKEILDEVDNTCIVILSIISDTEVIRRCVELGAAHFIRKDTPIPKMINTIQKAWKTFEEKKNTVNTSKYDLDKMLKEIKEDENNSYFSKKELSQNDINKFFIK